jgi:hypothetical protein
VAEEYEINRQQGRAFVDRVSHSMVYLLHQEPGLAPGSGSAVLVEFKGRIYLVSALHNFDFQGESRADLTRTWNETQFKFRDAGELAFHRGRELPGRYNLQHGIRLGRDRDMLTNPALDLIAVLLEPGEVVTEHVYPIKLEDCAYTGEIEEGAPLVTLGMPFNGAMTLPDGRRVLYPHTFEVQYDPAVSSSISLPFRLNRNDYIFYPYENVEEGVEPGGYSGAPVWSLHAVPDGQIWYPKPVVVGIVIKHHESKNVLRAVKVQHVVELLDSDDPGTDIQVPGKAR